MRFQRRLPSSLRPSWFSRISVGFPPGRLHPPTLEFGGIHRVFSTRRRTFVGGRGIVPRPFLGMSLSSRRLFLAQMPGDFVVTPWEVKGQVDYERLITQFGTQRITEDLLERIRTIAGELHPMLRRGVFYSHRDLDWILSKHEKGKPFALYTGRGPSSGIHIGHMLPWFFTKWLQEKFKATLYFQITDDEKFLFKDFDNLEEATKVGYDNILDIIAMGFDPKRTRIFLDTEYIRHLYPIAVEVAKRITFSTTQATFGFENSNNIGEIFYTSLQAAPAFLPTVEAGHEVPVLIPCGIDQDPHFRITRDVAPKLGYPKPALIHNKLLPSLLGPTGKMSASIPESSNFASGRTRTSARFSPSTRTSSSRTMGISPRSSGRAKVASGCAATARRSSGGRSARGSRPIMRRGEGEGPHR